MKQLADGRIEVETTDGKRATLTPGKPYDLFETTHSGVTRVEKARGWSHMVKADYALLRDALASKPEAA